MANTIPPPPPGFQLVPAQTMAEASPDGMLAPGNIDIHHRPVAHNPDGSISTVRSISVDEDGKSFLIPTVSPDGRVLSNKDAIDLFHRTGQHLGVFKTYQQADAYAQSLHNEQATEYAKYEQPKGNIPPPPPGFQIVDQAQPATQAPSPAQQAPQAPSIGQQIGRAFTMAGRNVVHGLAGIAGVVNDPIVNTLNYAEDKLGIDPKYRFGTAGQAADYVLNKAGVPDYQPQNGTERVVGRIEEGLGGLAGGAGIGSLLGRSSNAAAKGIGNALKESLGKQTIATAAGTAGGGITHEAGAGPKTELAISLLGGLSPLAAEGAVAGSARGLSRLLGPTDAQTSRLAKIAQDQGIPLKASQISESKTAKLLDSATGQVPLSGSGKFQDAQQAAFNRAVAKTIGEDADAITPEVFDRARTRLGQEFDRLATYNSIDITPDLVRRLGMLRNDVAQTGNQEAITAVEKAFERILNQQQNSQLPGEVYKSLTSDLGRMAAGTANPDKAHFAGQMRELLDDAMGASIRPEDAKAWATARRQYRDLKTIEPLVAEATANGGNVSPAKLMGRVMSNKAGKSSVARGKRGDLADLAAIGRQFIKEQVPDSGTARRTAVVDSLKGLGAVAGSAIGTGAAINPLAGLVAGSGAVGISRAVQNILKSPRLVNTLLKNPNLDPTLRKALEASINPSLQSLPPAANGRP